MDWTKEKNYCRERNWDWSLQLIERCQKEVESLESQNKKLLEQLDITIRELELFLETFKKDLDEIHVEELQLDPLLMLMNDVNRKIKNIKNDETIEEE